MSITSLCLNLSINSDLFSSLSSFSFFSFNTPTSRLGIADVAFDAPDGAVSDFCASESCGEEEEEEEGDGCGEEEEEEEEGGEGSVDHDSSLQDSSAFLRVWSPSGFESIPSSVSSLSSVSWPSASFLDPGLELAELKGSEL